MERKQMPENRTGNRQENSPVYHAAVYARLSVEKKGKEDDPDSIEAQILLAEQFAATQENIRLCACYTDRGRTGTDFNRQGFREMMQAIRQKKINCVIVKDLSRFGRNYLETGNYIEKVFPLYRVRLIAVADCFDSEEILWRQDLLAVWIGNLYHERYARDVARKVKAAKALRRKNGSYVGGAAPYGYRIRMEAKKRVLEANPQTEDVVRAVFLYAALGETAGTIRHRLNHAGIHSPQEYRKTASVSTAFITAGSGNKEPGREQPDKKESGREQPDTRTTGWSPAGVAAILKNPVYGKQPLPVYVKEALLPQAVWEAAQHGRKSI